MKADKAKVERLLKTARGQIDGVLKMVEQDKYCIDIANQILACDAVLKKTAREILSAHLKGCLYQAFESGDEQAKQEKIEEIAALFEKMGK